MEYEKKANYKEIQNKPDTKKAESEEFEFIDSIKDVLALNNQNLIENKIFENTNNIINFLKDIDNKLYEEFNLNLEEVNLLIKCLKFVDTLNLFMNQAFINNIVKLMYSINDSIITVNMVSKDLIIYQIRYTEKSLIYYRKAFFKNLFFQNDQAIFEKFDEILDENNLYDLKTFKQIQNLFYIFSMKLESKTKELLQQKMNYLKSVILRLKRSIFNNNDYNQHNKFKKFKEVECGMNNNYYYYNDRIDSSFANDNYDNYNSNNKNFQQYNNKPHNNNFVNNRNYYSNNVNNNFYSINKYGNQYCGYNVYNEGSNRSTHKYNQISNEVTPTNQNQENTFNNNTNESIKDNTKNSLNNTNANSGNSEKENNQTNMIVSALNEAGIDVVEASNFNTFNNCIIKNSPIKNIIINNKINTPINSNNNKNNSNIIINNNIINNTDSQSSLSVQRSSTIAKDLSRESSSGFNSFPSQKNEKVELITLDINQMFDINPILIDINPQSSQSHGKSQVQINKQSNQQQPPTSTLHQPHLQPNEPLGNKGQSPETKEDYYDDHNFSIDSSKSGDEEFEDLEEDEFSEENEEDMFNNYIKQDLENKLNLELYSDTVNKNDKIIFSNEVKNIQNSSTGGEPEDQKAYNNAFSNYNLNQSFNNEYSQMGVGGIGGIDTTTSNPVENPYKIKNYHDVIIEKKNLENSTPYIPIKQNTEDFHNQDFNYYKYQDQNTIHNNYQHITQSSQVLFKGHNSSIHREYFSLKIQEQENPDIFKKNLFLFEELILNPLYQKINMGVYKKKIKYYLAFTKYKNIIYRTLNRSKMLKKVKPYGSYVNNFLTENGDIDICIVPKCIIIDFSKHLEKLKEVIVEKDIGEFKLSHYNDRYLLLKVLDKETQFVIDITVHTMLPILNSKLVKTYAKCDQRFHIMGIYLKHWAKINKIHGAADNFLSSYALLLMLIHFLQKVVEPRILPNLQKVDRKEKMYSYSQGGAKIQTNIFFEENEVKIKKDLERINNGKVNEESAVTLLIKFFEYYSYYFYPTFSKVSISDDEEVMKTFDDGYPFSIVDPFDPTHNPGKSLTQNSLQFKKFDTSMKKEINYILTGEYIKRLDLQGKRKSS